MELSLRVESKSEVDDATLLKQFIARQNLEGIHNVELERALHQPGEQGLGKFLGTLLVNISESLNVFKELLTQLNVFASKYDRRIHLCSDIVIPSNKLTGDQIERIAIEALKKCNGKTE